MSFLSSCFGYRKGQGGDTEPLLPRYADDTDLQRRLHQKLHTYQMLRAMRKGYMPSTEQLIINLRTLLSTDIFNSNNPDLSDSGRLLVKHCRNWLKQFIEALRSKNDQDQIQDFIWYLTQSKISLDTDDVARQASRVRAKADTVAGECTPTGHIIVQANFLKPTKAFVPLVASFSQIRTSAYSWETLG
jgi:hypothetical protein